MNIIWNQQSSHDGGEVSPSPANSSSSDLSSKHSSNFPDLLRQLDASLLVSTYQAGKLVFVRPDGTRLNTHYRNFARPMGMALSPKGTLALGTRTAIVEFGNAPSVASILDPPNVYDAVFMPRCNYITGAIDAHEMAYGADETLWYVNTLFSCLCQLDRESSFAPIWRPKFVSKYSAEDRCHLNGLAMRDGNPATLTALGVSDDVEGWRTNKRDGGVVIDYASKEIIGAQLCMPHSPRWHQGKLWLLESGRGALLQLDHASGEKNEVVRLPGFLRGLDFVGPYAFVGLCQLRERNAFTDIPITENNPNRDCGIWVVDTRSGKVVSILKFTGIVQEVFTVIALRGINYAELPNDDDALIANTFVLPKTVLTDSVPPRPRPRPEQKPLAETLGIIPSSQSIPRAFVDEISALRPTPKINLDPVRPFVIAENHRVDILLTMKIPQLVILGGLLSLQECDDLIEIASSRMSRSLVVDKVTGGERIDSSRTSEGMFFKRDENELVSRIEKRIASLVNWPVEKGEGLQVLRYGPGEEYKPHYDYFPVNEPGMPSILKRGGQRVASIIMYLNSPEAAGGTLFADVGLEVVPQKGGAVFFSYEASSISKSLHGGSPVVAGEKWIATKWLREDVHQ